jgi:hypothetical protein
VEVIEIDDVKNISDDTIIEVITKVAKKYSV